MHIVISEGVPRKKSFLACTACKKAITGQRVQKQSAEFLCGTAKKMFYLGFQILPQTFQCKILENARVALVGRASEVLECARAFKRPRMRARV